MPFNCFGGMKRYFSAFRNYLKRYFNLRESYVFYGAYHNERRNKIVHVVFVPVIFTTALSFLCRFRISRGVNLSQLVAGIYALTFFAIDPLAGTLYWPVLLGMQRTGEYLARRNTLGCIALHLSGWASQILAHKYFEREKPAFMDDPLQAVHSAVFFVWLEVLFALGYRKGEYRVLQQLVDAKIKERKANTPQKIVCE